MVKVNTSETRPEGGGEGFDERCDCHFIVLGWEDKSGEDKPFVEIEVQSLTAVKPGGGELRESQVGKKRSERFSLHPKAVGKLLEWACAVGLYSKPQWAEDKKNNITADIDPELAIGRTFCAPIGMTSFDEAYWNDRLKQAQSCGDTATAEKAQEQITKNRGKSFPQLGGDKGFTFWAIGDVEADHVPLDQDSVPMPITGPLPTKQGAARVRGSKDTPPPAGHGAKAPPPVAPPAGNATPPSAASLI